MPRLIYRPGETITIKGKLVDAEAGIALPGLTVYLEQHDPTTGLFKPVMTTRTARDGSYEFSLRLPEEEGTYRYRTRSEETEAYKSDVSPSISITVKKPKAARTTLSLVVE
jgi:uncharacterized protein YfaS (alpha-2-macroglobulin family)